MNDMKKPVAALDGAGVIVDYIIREKVPYAFGLCGHGNIGFIDALYERSSEIKTVSVRHEAVAGFMADCYYRVSGKPTVTFTSCGPGSSQLPIALANSYFDSVPFLAVTGNVPTTQFNRGAFQETYRQYQADFPSTVRAYCKRVFQPTRPEQVALQTRLAWKTMVTGRPGPVVLDVPFDIFRTPVEEETPRPEEWNANISCRCGADPEGVAKAVDMLLSATRQPLTIPQIVRPVRLVTYLEPGAAPRQKTSALIAPEAARAIPVPAEPRVIQPPAAPIHAPTAAASAPVAFSHASGISRSRCNSSSARSSSALPAPRK